MSPYFIKHPVVATVFAVVTTLLGLVCLANLPIEQYPEITPRTIQLRAMFPGADAKSVADSVGTPLERQVSGVQGMDYMSSISSNNGSYALQCVFSPETVTDMDQMLTNMRYGQAQSQMPKEVLSSGITITQMPGLPLMIYSITSPDGSHRDIDLSNYAQVKMVDELKRVPGVGEVMVYGAGRYAIRVWLNTPKMTHYNISVEEVRAAITVENNTNPGGKIGAEPIQDGQEKTFALRTQGRMSTPEEFENIIVRKDGDGYVYLKDIADVELGSEDYSITGRINGNRTANVLIYQSPGSNAIATVDRVTALLEKQKAAMPEGLTGNVTLDTTVSVRNSIAEIRQTFIEAIILVALVVFVFLQNLRATFIPLIAVPVSLLSTFIVFPLLGFTLNTISLLGMVLAIGLVVDDAIVVVEAVQHHIDQGLKPRMATFAAMQEVSGPVIAIALVLSAVFLPSLMMSGISGTLFKQFAITIAISMLVSAFNALTLSPALCTLLLKEKGARKTLLARIATPFYNIFNKCYNALADAYVAGCRFLCKRLYLGMALLLGTWAAIIPASERVPGAFLPDEDQGFLMAAIVMKSDQSLQVTMEECTKLYHALQDPTVKNIAVVSGINIMNFVQTPGAAAAFVQLKEWKDRSETAHQIHARLSKRVAMAGLDAKVAMVNIPPAIPGVGTSNGVSMVLTDLEGQGVPFLYEQVLAFEAAARALPEVGLCMDMMMPDTPQVFVDVDKEKCLYHNVDIKSAYNILAAYNGSSFVNFFNAFGQQWQVYMQARGKDRRSLDCMDGFFVTGRTGKRVPLSALVNIRDSSDTEFVMHHNIYNAAKLLVMPKPGYSSEQLMTALEKLYETSVDHTKIGFDYQDMSFQENKVRNSIGLGTIFALSALFAYLILAALYEKWTLPLSIFLTVPIAVLGAYLGLMIMGLELNLYAQVGLIMLVGLAAKNAILIVEFANLEIGRGKDLLTATLTAARLRLRPILMTSIAFILGCMPLVYSTGAGALARNAIGIVVVAGMLMATVVGVFLIPCSYMFIMRLFRITYKLNENKADPDEEAARDYLAAHTDK